MSAPEGPRATAGERTAARQAEPPRGVAPVQAADDEHPRLEFSGRRLLALGGFLLLALAALYFLLPQVTGLQHTWQRIENGSPWWLGLGVIFTAGMFGGYVAMFRGVFLQAGGTRLGWRASYEITMAGLAASRIFAAGGAGGLVLTAWALRQAGMEPRQVADKTLSFLILTYLPYVLSLIVCGLGLRWGILPGDAPFTLTVVPAIFAAVAIAVGVACAFVPPDLQRRVQEEHPPQGRFGRLVQRAANFPAAASAGMRDAFAHARAGDASLLGAVLYWAFQIAVLWAAFNAFGDSPTVPVLVQAFFVGMLGNLLPLPGGVGGVEGGMIGAFSAFGVSTGLAVVAVLVYRAFTFWLPLVPGIVAYFQLRRTVERWRAGRGGVPLGASAAP
jgi:uncharacterized membrane protein YbhN (UPF0104 family)